MPRHGGDHRQGVEKHPVKEPEKVEKEPLDFLLRLCHHPVHIHPFGEIITLVGNDEGPRLFPRFEFIELRIEGIEKGPVETVVRTVIQRQDGNPIAYFDMNRHGSLLIRTVPERFGEPIVL